MAKPMHWVARRAPFQVGNQLRVLAKLALALLFALFCIYTIAAGTNALGEWRGGNLNPFSLLTHDLSPFVRLSVPIAVLLGCTVFVISKAGAGRRGVTAASLFAISITTLYWYLVFRFYGLPRGLVTIQFLVCWLSGAVALLLILTTKRSQSLPWILVVLLLAIFVPKRLYDTVAHNQRLSVVFVEAQPRSADRQTASAQPSPEDASAQCDPWSTMFCDGLQVLRLRHPDQDFRVLTYETRGEGDEAVAIFVLRGPVQQTASLPEPYRSTVFYFQQASTWAKDPSDAVTLDRQIEIRPPNRRGELGWFVVQEVGRAEAVGQIRAKD